MYYCLQYLEWQGPATTQDNTIVMSVTYKSSELYQPGCSLIGISSVTMVRKLFKIKSTQNSHFYIAVSVGSCEFLDTVEYMPELDVSKANNALYNYVPDLEQCRVCKIILINSILLISVL